jgi:hypothetical protein
VFEIVKSGGILMLPIILCSIVALAISIERWWTLDIRKIVPPGTVADVWEWIRRNELTTERLRKLQRSSPLGRILAAGLANAQHGREVMKESIQDAAAQVVHDLERYLNTLGVIAEVTPLIGLLGTPWNSRFAALVDPHEYVHMAKAFSWAEFFVNADDLELDAGRVGFAEFFGKKLEALELVAAHGGHQARQGVDPSNFDGFALLRVGAQGAGSQGGCGDQTGGGFHSRSPAL